MTPDQQTDDFEKRFELLDLLSECEQTTSEFNDEYERLFNDIKALPGARYEKTVRLKILQIKQSVFLCTLAVLAEANEGMN